jgi:iron complex outermembrane receptor protein
VKRVSGINVRELALGVAVAALFPGVAFAQSGPAAQDSPLQPDSVQTLPASDKTAKRPRIDDTEIVVTGTLIRGIAPAGNNVINMTPGQVAATGGTTSNQILASLPQVANFFNAMPVGVSAVAGSNASNPISRPNLRNLPAANTSGGAQTLVLMDGHRVVGGGTQQVAVDPDMIAPGVIERVEALTDGGSAVYGSDALGGVLNFITRRRFDGVQASARYGFGDDYRTVDGSLMAGKDWGSGGFYVAYGYSHHDAIFGSDRDFVRNINYTTNVPVGRNCGNPNVTVGGASYVVSGATLAAGGPNSCDVSDDFGIYPRTTLHNAYARLVQDLSENIHFDFSALYANRATTGYGGTLGQGNLGGGATGTVTLQPTNPNYRPVPGAATALPETVQFNYGPLLGYRSGVLRTNFETFSLNPSLAADLGAGWQARALMSYGRSVVDYKNSQVSAAAQTAAVANGSLNPFNVAATSPATVAALTGFDRGLGRNELYDYRAIVDGPLFALPGGDIHVALGAEHMQDNFRRRISSAALVLQPPADYTQKVDSLFGELQLPLVSKDNARPMLHELTVSASARYDKYNDFGDTFNPKVGVTYRPIPWVALRGNWGKSFNAPSPTDQLGTATSTASLVPGAFLMAPPGVTFAANETGVFLGSGTAAGLTPQKATNWSFGAELTPPFAEGLTLNASYYHIKLKGTIGRPVTGAALGPFFASFPNLYIARPSGQQLTQFLSTLKPSNINFTVVNPTSTAQAMISSGGNIQPVGLVLDTLVRNLGETSLSGLDFAANYLRPTGFGSLDISVAGNYRLTQKTQISAAAPTIDDLRTEIPHMVLSSTLGANIDNLRAQVAWNHTAGYLRGDAGLPQTFGQSRVKAFDAINLFFRWDVPEKLLGKDLQFTANVQNLFDVSPPLYKSVSANGYDAANGHAFSIGRVIQFGINKRF